MKRKSTLVASLVILLILAGANSTWGAGGGLLWEKTFDCLPDYTHLQGDALKVCNSSNISIVYGIAMGNIGKIIFIKAFDVETGNLKWERNIDYANLPGWPYVASDFCTITIDGNKGYITTRTYESAILGAFNVINGETLWENTLNNSILVVTTPVGNQTSINHIVTAGIPSPDYDRCNVKVYRAHGSDSTRN